MSFKRFITVNVLSGSSLYDDFVPVSQGGDYIVDDSHFVPMSEAVKQLGSSVATSDVISKSYDFVDGRDTGIKVPVDRLHDVKDLAELSVAVRNRSKDLSESLEQESYNSKLKSIINKSGSDSGSDSGSTASSSGSK